MKAIAKKLVKNLIKKKINISFAESCTGGLLASTITAVSGSSKIFNVGIVAYSNESKINILKIPKNIIKKYGAVSLQVCLSMVYKIYKIANTDLSVSITGIAGPGGGSKKKPVGLVYIGIKKGSKIEVKKYIFRKKKRFYIQKSAVNKALELIFRSIK